MPYAFTDYNNMVNKRPRQLYWKELQDAVNDLDSRFSGNQSGIDEHIIRMDNPHNVTSAQVNTIAAKSATDAIQNYPLGYTVFPVAELSPTGFPGVYGVVETIYISEYRNAQRFTAHVENGKAGAIYYRSWDAVNSKWAEWEQVVTMDDLSQHTNNSDIHITQAERDKLAGMTSGATKVEDSATNGAIKVTDADGIVTEINVYTHLSGDGNLHVPATGTVNDRKVLKAGATAGSAAWSQVQMDEIGGTLADTQHGQRAGGALHAVATQTSHGFMDKDDKVKLDNITDDANHVAGSATNGSILIDGVDTTVYTHPATHSAAMIDETDSRKFVSPSEKNRWNDTFTTAQVNQLFTDFEASLDIKEAVGTYDDILTTYPAPEDGWLVSTRDTDVLYRYNGAQWIPLSSNALPLASATEDGLMSKEDKDKLDNIENGGEINQNAFSFIQVGTDIIEADSKTDTLNLAAGDNVVLTVDTDNDTITIGLNGTIDDANTVGGLAPDVFMKKTADSKLSFPIVQDGRSNGIEFVGSTDRHEVYIEEYGEAELENTRLVFLNSDGPEDHTVFRHYNTATGETRDVILISNDHIDIGQILNALGGLAVSGDASFTGNLTGGTYNGINVTDFKAAYDAHVGSGDVAHALATQASHGFFSKTDKAKLDAIMDEAEKNQNAIAAISNSSGTLSAAEASQSVQFLAGAGMDIAINNADKTVTFSATGASTPVGNTPPSYPTTGQTWIDTSDIDPVVVSPLVDDTNFTAAQLQFESDQKNAGNETTRMQLQLADMSMAYQVMSAPIGTVYNFDGSYITPDQAYNIMLSDDSTYSGLAAQAYPVNAGDTIVEMSQPATL